MRRSRLRHRIALVFVGLLLLVQGSAYVVLRRDNERVARSELERQIEGGERVFRSTLHDYQQQLDLAAGVLAADFGFRSAVATHDGPTIRTALENHGQRIGASAMMLVSLDGRVLADTFEQNGGTRRFPYQALAAAALREGSAHEVAALDDGAVYQLVVLPIMAPDPIALLAIGFRLDDEFAQRMHALLGLDVSLVRSDATGALRVSASSLQPGLRAALGTLDERVLARATHAPAPIALDGSDYETRVLAVGTAEAGAPVAVLQRSLDAALAPYARLLVTLGVVTLGGIALFAVGSFDFARRLADPIQRLAAGARRIEAGEYSAPIAIETDDEIGALAGSLNSMREAIARREAQIARLAYDDAVTGLPNRASFVQALATALSGGVAGAAVLAIDLDGFKLVNDSLGYDAGDALLVEVARRLRADVGEGDAIASLGADEYAVLLANVDAARATERARALLEALSGEPIQVLGEAVSVGASIGVACFPEHGRGAVELMRKADAAMNAAKRRRLGVLAYDAAHEVDSRRHLVLRRELREAVEQNQLVLHYQPKVAIDEPARVIGAEALLRWNHPQRGQVPPADFIPFAEATGAIRALTTWVIEHGIAQLRAWREGGLDVTLAINIAAQDLLRADLPALVSRTLARNRLPPSALCLEITESGFMQDPERSLRVVGELAAAGVELAIDDYGIGYSSLAYLQKLPVSSLKIDKSFVLNMTRSEDDAAIVGSTIALGHQLGLRVVAEGVETDEHLAALRALGCDVAQGYGIARPMAADRFAAWFAARARDQALAAGADALALER